MQISDGVQVSDAFQALNVATHRNMRAVVLCRNFSVGGRLGGRLTKEEAMQFPGNRRAGKRWDHEGQTSGQRDGYATLSGFGHESVAD